MLKNRLLLIVLFALLVAGTQFARYTQSPSQPQTPARATTQSQQPTVATSICKFKAAGA